MQSLNTIKDKSQQSWHHLVETGKQQPAARKLWGVTIAAADGCGIVLAAVSKGVLAVVGALAAPPVALTVGALAGGALGWSLMQNQSAEITATTPAATPTAEVTA